MSQDIDEALDALGEGGGSAEIERERGRVVVNAADVGRLGVRMRSLKVRHDRGVDVEREAASLPERLRSLPERVVPVEVAPKLGGATLRTRPEDMRNREFFEVEVDTSETEVRRMRVGDDGDRKPVDWSVTRDQLERLIDEVHDADDT